MHREIISIGIKLRSPVSISYIYAPASETHQKVIFIKMLSSRRTLKAHLMQDYWSEYTYTHKLQRLKKQQPKPII